MASFITPFWPFMTCKNLFCKQVFYFKKVFRGGTTQQVDNFIYRVGGIILADTSYFVMLHINVSLLLSKLVSRTKHQLPSANILHDWISLPYKRSTFQKCAHPSFPISCVLFSSESSFFRCFHPRQNFVHMYIWAFTSPRETCCAVLKTYFCILQINYSCTTSKVAQILMFQHNFMQCHLRKNSNQFLNSSLGKLQFSYTLR